MASSNNDAGSSTKKPKGLRSSTEKPKGLRSSTEKPKEGLRSSSEKPKGLRSSTEKPKEGLRSSTEKPKGSSSSPPDLFDAFIAYVAEDSPEEISKLKEKTWLQNNWTHEEDCSLTDLLKQYNLHEDELDVDLFKKYGQDELFRRYSEIAKNLPNRSRTDVSWRHCWFQFKKANNEEGSSSEKAKGSSSSPPSVDYDDFLASLYKNPEELSEMKSKTWFQNNWTHEEDNLLNKLLKKYWTSEELDGEWMDLFGKYGSDEMHRRYGEIAMHFRNRNGSAVGWRHSWFIFKKKHESRGKEAEPTESVGSSHP